MGRYFKDKEDLYQVVRALTERIITDPEIGRRLSESKLIIQFRYKDPDAVVTVNFKDPAQKERAFGSYQVGETRLVPDVTMTQSADFSHLFWYGRANIMKAIATRKVIAKGSVQKALKLLPAIKPMFKLYPQILKEIGREDLLLTEPEEKERRRKGLKAYLRSLFPAARGRRALGEMSLFQTAPLRIAEPLETPSIRKIPLPEDQADLKKEMLRRMILIRRFEEAVSREFAEGRIPTQAIHLSVGQEAVAVGVCFALRPEDTIVSTHRGHGHLLAKGADPTSMMAEIFGKAAGLCKGKGGSMHVTDASVGALGANGIVGASTLIATGAGLSSTMKGAGLVSVAFLGDGGTNQGMFHEAVNLAAVWDLPVIFVIENNLYGEFTPLSRHCRIDRLSRRADAYGIKGVTVDGNDPWQVYLAAKEAVQRARKGDGPTLLECLTYRWHGHMEGETAQYRPQEEVEQWKARCPISRWRKRIIKEGIIDQDQALGMENEIASQIDQAIFYALESAEPDPSEVMDAVYAPEPAECYEKKVLPPAAKEITLSEAINMALAEEMRRDERVFLIGEDVSAGGYFAVTSGLVEEFGRDRVRDTPISEYAIIGASVGAAMTGMRPVAEILFSDFLTTCMDPIVNQAAKLRYMSGGQYSIPIVIRTPGGAGLGLAAQHSQSLEALLMGIPGLIILAPSKPTDAKGMLKSAIRSNNPVLFFEHKLLYIHSEKIPEGEYLVPIGKAAVRRQGKDVTVVSLLYMVHEALSAAEALEKEGIDTEVIDLRSLVPMDIESVIASLRKTGRLLIVEEGPLRGGFGAELAAVVGQIGLDLLRAPMKRLGARDTPIPYNVALERTVLPDAGRIIDAVRGFFR